jgi:hypothetical protein
MPVADFAFACDTSSLVAGVAVPTPTFCEAFTVIAVVPAVCMFKIPVLSAVVITPPTPEVDALSVEAII